MKYEILSVTLSVIACVLSVAHWTTCQRKFKVYLAWTKWDGAGLSTEYKEFCRLHNMESFLSVGIMLPFSVVFVLADLANSRLLAIPYGHQWVLNYAELLSLVSLIAALFISEFRKCPPA